MQGAGRVRRLSQVGVIERYAERYAERCRDLDAQPGSVAAARGTLSDFAADVGASAIQVDKVRLAVSEAVTNAVLHAYRGLPGHIHVTAALAGSELWILIADDGGGMRPEADRPGLGLGLGLISRVCDDMAIGPRSSGGTEVRILFKLAVAAEPQGAPVAPAAAEMAVGIPDVLSAVPTAPLPD